jgi:hypothetical protein
MNGLNGENPSQGSVECTRFRLFCWPTMQSRDVIVPPKGVGMAEADFMETQSNHLTW